MDSKPLQTNPSHFNRFPAVDKTFIDIRRWLLVIFLVALAYRGLYFLNVQQNPLFLNPVIDAEQHHAWAQRISSGAILGSGPDDVFKPFLYPLFLGGVYYLFGPNMTVIQWFQFFLGSLSAALTALLCAVLTGKRAGIIAGFVCALYAPFLFFEGQLLTPAISISVNLVLTLMLIRQYPSWGMIGLLGGVAAGFRPDVLVPLAFVLCFRLLYFVRAEGVRKAVVKMVFLAAGFLAIAIPLTARNYALTGQWVLFSSNAGINFYTGNGPAADGVSAIPTGLAWEQIISTVPKEIMREPASVSRLWFSRGLDAIAQDPIAWLKLIGKKTFAFFNGLEFRNNIGYSWFRENVPWLNIPFIQYWPVSALAVLGLCLCLVKRRRIPERTIILLWIAGYFVVGLAFFVTARYRLPTVPFMIIFGTWASYWLYRRCAGSMKGVGQAVFLVALIFGVTWPGWIESTKGSNSRDYINLGNVLRKNGEPQKAISAYKNAFGADPEEAEGWFLAGTTYLNLNLPEQAIDYLTRAAGLCPTGADIMLNLGSAHFLKGNADKAEDQYKALIRLADETNLYHKRSSVAKAHIGLWGIYGRQGDTVEATKQMESAWRVDEQVAAEYSVMNGLELERAALVLERLAQEEPRNWYPRANLGIAYFKMGRFDQAATALKKSSGLRGSLPGVRFHLGLALINSGKKGEGREILERLLDEVPESSLRNLVQNILNSVN